MAELLARAATLRAGHGRRGRSSTCATDAAVLGTLPGALDAWAASPDGAQAWISDLFGPAPALVAWRRDARRLLSRTGARFGGGRERSLVASLLDRPVAAWPRVAALHAHARAASDSSAVALAALEAHLRAGDRAEARRASEDVLLTATDPARVWRAWTVLGFLHQADGRRELARAAFEAAAAFEGCGVQALVEALAAHLVVGDEPSVRRAAARLELVTSPASPAFLRAVESLEARRRCCPDGTGTSDDARVAERRALLRWRDVLGTRPTAATAVLGALA